MANICNNDFFCNSENEENLKVVEKFITDELNAEIYYIDESTIEATFESKWRFPESKMEELFYMIPNKDDIFMRCMSTEFNTLYHELWVCDDNNWISV